MRQLRRLRPYFRYLAQVRSSLVAAIFYAVLYGASSGVGIPALVQYVFPPIFDRDGIALPMSTVVLIAACIPVAFLLRALSGYLNSYHTQHAGVRILEALRLDYFRKLQFLPLSFVQRRQTGDLLSRGMADTQQLQYTLTLLANDGVKQPIVLLGAIGYLAWQAVVTDGVALVLLSMAIVPLAVFPIRFVGRKVVKRAQQLQARLGDATSVFSENLSAAREVRAFSLEERETGRFAALTHELVVAQMKIVKYAQALTPAIEFIAAAGIAATLVFAYGTGVSYGTFFAIVSALYMSYEPIKKLGNLNNELKRGIAALERLEVVLNEPILIADPAKPVTVGRLRGELAFDAVTFAYHDGVPALRDVSITIPPGTVCALVGPSGAGKSTFANLVPRFYEGGTGSIKVDGIDVRGMRLADLRRNIAIVSQEPVLFNDTIYNNLLLGRAGATRAEVEQAARDAFAHDFILTQPHGYDTIVGERGAKLSGGQKQRIALARAFLRNAPMLILDEATSALDSESEAAIQAALHKLVVGKTVLIIAHRFSTIRDASLILVFNEGRIVASGTHAELYAANPLYRTLYDRQHGHA
ncbi:MAG TPA: ABC transporter ATP-binding protein [Opitutaceae bacterium]